MSLTKVPYSMIQGAPVNVLDFGAVGDNLTDCTTAFQTALASGKAVYVPKGDYVISGALVLADNNTMFGDGPNLSILKCDTDTFTGEFLTIGGRSFIENLSLAGTGTKAGTGIYFASSTGVYDFTGHSSATNVRTSGFDVGFKVNNFFDLEFHRCEAYQNVRGWQLDPQYSVSSDSGYYTTITLLKCYSAFNEKEGFYANSTINGRVLHFIDTVVEFNCSNDAASTGEISITKCFEVAFDSCYTESSAGTTKPWLLLEDVSTCSIKDHWAQSTNGVDIGDYTAQLTLINSTIEDLTGAASGTLGQNIYVVGSQIGTKTVGITVTQRYIATTVDGNYEKDLCIANQLSLVDDASNTSTLNVFRLYKKTVSATIPANSSTNLITDYYVSLIWSADIVGLANIANAYAPGLILQVLPATSGSPDYFNVVATNTTSSPITLTNANLKVAFFTGNGMAI